KKKHQIHPVAKASLVEIPARRDRPEEAAKIANAVALEYKNLRLDQRREVARAEIKALEERSLEQEGKVREAKEKVEELGQELQVNKGLPKDPDESNPKRPAADAAAPIPQPEVATHDNAFSTFSLNVSDVSFKLAAASLEKGQMPEPASIRSEEFINAFDYRDPEPGPGAPIAFAWE